METLWFWLVAVMLVMYVIFDGFDLGVGILHPWVARSEDERRVAIRSIGPVWDGNEVWLLAAAGALYFAFPVLYASAFSGFYLPLMMVLWLLIGRACAIEFRAQLEGSPWRPFWDAAFSVSSLLLALFFGTALGNVVRGVPLDAEAHFFCPLWTDFLPRGQTGILDVYTVLVGACAVAALAMHGGLWLVLKTEGPLQERSRRAALAAAAATAALVLLATGATALVQPHALRRLFAAPWGWILPASAALNLAIAVRFTLLRRELPAFLASCAFLGAILVTVVFSLFPFVLPATSDPDLALTVWSTAAAPHGLKVGLAWWIPGILLVAAYFAYTYRRFSGKVRPDDPGY